MNPDPQPEEAVHIRIRGLTMAFGSTVVMENLDFAIHRGDIFVIMGPSGSGKSTLMRHMIGLLEPAGGEILYSGRSFTGATGRERVAILRRIGVMYQRGALWTSLTLAENVALPLEEFTDYSRRQIRSIVDYKLSLVGLSGFGDYYPASLSGGMAKRAGVARALALYPEILFLDAPSSGLDPLSARRLDETIVQLRDSLGMTVIVVTHELDSIFQIGTRAVYLDPESRTQGAVGDPRELRDHADNDRIRHFLKRDPLTPGTE